MEIYTDWRALRENGNPTAYALGSFDGVHAGHRGLLRSVAEARPDLDLGVITFEPHPRSFFRSYDSPFRLMDRDQKRSALADLGVKRLYELAFDGELASKSANDFVQEVLIEGVGARHIGCGADFAFGRARQGDVGLLKDLLIPEKIGVTVCPALGDEQGPYSSTRIRRYLCEGDMARARELLGRPWIVRGVVEHGDKRGRQLGFPTANVELGAFLEPARGAYVCAVKLDNGEIFQGVANVGCRPTVSRGQSSRVEAHLFDFSGDLYGSVVEVALLDRLRDEKRFNGLDELIAQIESDASNAKIWFSKNPTPRF